jgi:hypothetical protein
MPTKLKDHSIVTTRDFMRQFSSIIKSPKSKRYTIMKHGKPVAIVIPYPVVAEDWWQGIENVVEPEIKPKKHLTLEEFRKKHSFHSGEKHLSQRIDEIVYGVKFK